MVLKVFRTMRGIRKEIEQELHSINAINDFVDKLLVLIEDLAFPLRSVSSCIAPLSLW